MIEKTKTEIYKLSEIIEYLKISRRTLINYINSGKLPAFKIGVEWRVTKDNFEIFMEKLIKGELKK